MSRVYRNKGDWWVDFKDAAGVRHRKKVGSNKRIAREVLDGFLGNVARRQHLGVIEDSAISFSDFAEDWWKRIAHTLKPRTRERWRGIVDKHLKPAFPGSLRGVTAAGAEAYVARRVDQKAQPSTVNREMTVLKHMMRRAVEWECRSRNPFIDTQGRPLAGVKALREPSGRTRFLTLEEIDRLLMACAEKPYLEAFAIVTLNTGMRRNEVLSLTRQSIDWANNIATLDTTKNGEARHVPLNDAALDALRGLPTRLDGRLLPFGPNQVSVAFKRAVRRAGIEDFRLHDLRHTFASYQAMAGTQGRGLQALLGHKDGRMTMRYSHLSDAYLHAAVNGVQFGRREEDATGTKAKG
jgi:integrase